MREGIGQATLAFHRSRRAGWRFENDFACNDPFLPLPRLKERHPDHVFPHFDLSRGPAPTDGKPCPGLPLLAEMSSFAGLKLARFMCNEQMTTTYEIHQLVSPAASYCTTRPAPSPSLS